MAAIPENEKKIKLVMTLSQKFCDIKRILQMFQNKSVITANVFSNPFRGIVSVLPQKNNFIAD
jgi:hypothetical protein